MAAGGLPRCAPTPGSGARAVPWSLGRGVCARAALVVPCLSVFRLCRGRARWWRKGPKRWIFFPRRVHAHATCLLPVRAECLALTTGNLERKFRFLHGTVFGPATQQAAAAVPAPPSAAATSPSPLAGAAQTTPPAAPDASGAAARSAPSGAPPPLPPWESQAQVDAQQQAQPQRGGGAEGEAWGGAAATRAAVLVYPAALNHSLLNELGPRFSYVLDRGKLHHVLAYNEVVRAGRCGTLRALSRAQRKAATCPYSCALTRAAQSRRVTLSLGRLLGDADTDRFLARVAGEPQDFASFCSRWRRTQAGKLTVTPTGASSTGSSWSNEASW